MGIFSSIWKYLTAAAGLIASFFFVKSKIQENEIEKQQSEIAAKDEQIAAKESEIKVKEKQYQNENDIKDFEVKVAKKENKIDSDSASRDDQLEKKVLNTKDGKEYKVSL